MDNRASVTQLTANLRTAINALYPANVNTIMSNFSIHNMVSGNGGSSGFGIESMLDIQAVKSLVPGATVQLVLASSAYSSSLLSAITYAVNTFGANIVSMSFGTSSPDTTFNSFINSHPNVLFVASSGDTFGQVNWPAALPNCIGVGVTTLTGINPLVETVWRNNSNGNGSGGGMATTGVNVQQKIYLGLGGTNPNHLNTSFRYSPDVSLDANPVTGFPVLLTNIDGYGSGTYLVGGTSLSAPILVSFLALVNSNRITNHKSVLTQTQFFNTLYHNPPNFTTGVNAEFYDLTGSIGVNTTNVVPYSTIVGMRSPLYHFFTALMAL